jgi:hypothetical protein
MGRYGSIVGFQTRECAERADFPPELRIVPHTTVTIGLECAGTQSPRRATRQRPSASGKNLIISRFEGCPWDQSTASDVKAINGVSKHRHGVYYAKMPTGANPALF